MGHHLTSHIRVTCFVAAVAGKVHSRIRTYKFSMPHSPLVAASAYQMVRAPPAKLTACHFG